MTSRITMIAGVVFMVCLATSLASADVVSFDLDGIIDGNDSYSMTKQVRWYNGHDSSTYGTINSTTDTTTVHYGSDASNFFVYVEVPIYAKNMIWSRSIAVAGGDPNVELTTDDLDKNGPYGKDRLDMNGATGSEYMGFGNSGWDVWADLGWASATGTLDGYMPYDFGNGNPYGFVDFKNSVNYIYDNGLYTGNLKGGTYLADVLKDTTSLNRDMPLSFEFKFDLDAAKNNAFLALLDTPVNVHLSPDRGLMAADVPEPATMSLLALGGLAALRRRKK